MEQSKFYQIKNITEHEYTLVGCDDSVITRPIRDIDKSASAFTIQDAKDGDVLVCESGERTLECLFIFKLIADREVHEYCSYRTIDKHFSLKDSFLGYVDNVYHPATEEQRDYLFQKINEAGYEWDADKKELKKVEQKPIWSEEDELNFKQAIYVCNQHYYFEVENWLKSLKDRIQQPK